MIFETQKKCARGETSRHSGVGAESRANAARGRQRAWQRVWLWEIATGTGHRRAGAPRSKTRRPLGSGVENDAHARASSLRRRDPGRTRVRRTIVDVDDLFYVFCVLKYLNISFFVV